MIESIQVRSTLEVIGHGEGFVDAIALIDAAFDHSFPHEGMPEVLKVASELIDSFHVA